MKTLGNVFSTTKIISKLKSAEILIFLPGLFLVTLGIAVVINPKLLLVLLAAFVISVGVVLSVLAYKIVKLKNSLIALSKKLQTRVVIQGVGGAKEPLVRDTYEKLVKIEPKKIILH